MQKTDVAIIGGGIVGLATAYALLERHPDRHVLILEKESEPAVHQTGHNSGVLHSGIYYSPGSLKASTCRAGKEALQAFCDSQRIDYEICGKVIVAADESEVPALERIFERGKRHGVQCERIGPSRLRQLEPHAAGVQAIHVPETGIIDFRRVCVRLREIVCKRGGHFLPGAKVQRLSEMSDGVRLESTGGVFLAGYVVNCAGLHSDRVTRMSGQSPTVRIIPFRGEYYRLKPEAIGFCRNLIYPVPRPDFPFLGVHFTRALDGSVHCGPNAVLAFAREGYRRRDINPRDLAGTLAYPGFRKLARRHWRVGLEEMWRSFSKAAFVKALQRLLPELRAEHLEVAPAGVRAQAVSPQGALVDDFLIQESERIVNVCNAPSPAATGSLSIGQMIVDRLAASRPDRSSRSSAAPSPS